MRLCSTHFLDPAPRIMATSHKLLLPLFLLLGRGLKDSVLENKKKINSCPKTKKATNTDIFEFYNNNTSSSTNHSIVRGHLQTSLVNQLFNASFSNMKRQLSITKHLRKVSKKKEKTSRQRGKKGNQKK